MSSAPIHSRTERRISRVLGSVLIFAALGPAIAGLPFVAYAIVAARAAKGQAGSPSAMDALLGGIATSYMVGLLPAALAGLLVGIALARSGRVAWSTVLIVSFVVAGLSIPSLILWLGLGLGAGLARVAIPGIVACTLPTIICAAIVRRMDSVWWRSADSASREQRQ